MRDPRPPCRICGARKPPVYLRHEPDTPRCKVCSSRWNPPDPPPRRFFDETGLRLWVIIVIVAIVSFTLNFLVSYSIAKG